VRRPGAVPADQVMKPSVPGGNRHTSPHVGPVLGPPVIALGYIRRSKESGARTVSLEDQRARIEAYCEERGWRLAEVLADDGVSGGRRERLERLAERVKATHARAIVVYHLDRFARDLAATLDYLRRFSRRGVELHVVGRGQVEADTATGFIVTAVEGLAAEHYRRVISEKTRDALARLRANGRRVSRFARYGYRLAPGRRLVVNPTEQVVLGKIVALRDQGFSLRAISRALATQGALARNGRPFGPSTLLGIVRNRTVPNTKHVR
jgi:DNA invertase Pin-like site-specific DNA recombinase